MMSSSSSLSNPFLIVFTLVLSPLVLLCPCFAAAGRRILHQPLFPVDWNPPPAEISYPPPVPSSSDQPFFPNTPSQPTTPGQAPPAATVAANAASASPGRRSGAAKQIALGVSVSVAALALVAVSACFLYRRRVRTSDGSEKLVGEGNGGSGRFPPPGRATIASDLLYLGTVEPSSLTPSVESNSSPYRKLKSVRAPEIVHQPSPELQPMPSLAGQRRPIEPPVVLSDDDAFYTPQRSVASVTSGSPCSTVSRKSLSTLGTGKEIAVCAVGSTPLSRVTSPGTRLSSASSSEVKQDILPTRPPPPPPPLPPPPSTGAPPPPPPPPRPPLSLLPSPAQTRAPAPSPRPVPLASAETPLPPPPQSPLTHLAEVILPEGASSFPVPVRPSSRRQWVKPASSADIPVPVAEAKSSFRSNFSARPIVRGQDDMGDGAKPRLKPLHWDKVRASSDRAMVWDQLKSSSFQLNEDMFETLFCTSTSVASREGNRRLVLPSGKQENRVLDPKKSQNIAILLRALTVTWDEVSEALLDGTSEGLGVELLETLIKMAPTKEEELRLRDYTDDVSKLGSAERFLKALSEIPFAFERIHAMLYRANFDSELKYLRKSFGCLEEACEELKNSCLFLKLLDAVLKVGNRMNVGTVRGQAKAFKLDTLLKLADVKGTDGKTTLLHFVVQEIIRSEGAAFESTEESNPLNKVKEDEFKKQGLKMVAGLGKELGNVKKAAGMDSDVLSGYVSKLELGLEKIKMVLQLGRTSSQGRFFEAMKVFLKEAEEEIARVKAEKKRALALVKEITEYFHGDTAKEEAHPFRIFMVVRDFLSVLDHVCKEVEKTQARTIVGSAGSFRISSSASVPVLNRFNARRDKSSDEDSSSS